MAEVIENAYAFALPVYTILFKVYILFIRTLRTATFAENASEIPTATAKQNTLATSFFPLVTLILLYGVGTTIVLKHTAYRTRHHSPPSCLAGTGTP